ncbi:hypothetical protein DBV15_05856 [Temnothorax longispinosus]|uniref:Uncharacterized protein n=1 Tax=Temnothorax longispinosus TaxID=300112 RepID=A0A4S2JMQ5_9HYME|nr:hypothetical protein DBV15_05856 [Temnothorax longispinosus]
MTNTLSKGFTSCAERKRDSRVAQAYRLLGTIKSPWRRCRRRRRVCINRGVTWGGKVPWHKEEVNKSLFITRDRRSNLKPKHIASHSFAKRNFQYSVTELGQGCSSRRIEGEVPSEVPWQSARSRRAHSDIVVYKIYFCNTWRKELSLESHDLPGVSRSFEVAAPIRDKLGKCVVDDDDDDEGIGSMTKIRCRICELLGEDQGLNHGLSHPCHLTNLNHLRPGLNSPLPNMNYLNHGLLNGLYLPQLKDMMLAAYLLRVGSYDRRQRNPKRDLAPRTALNPHEHAIDQRPRNRIIQILTAAFYGSPPWKKHWGFMWNSLTKPGLVHASLVSRSRVGRTRKVDMPVLNQRAIVISDYSIQCYVARIANGGANEAK